MNQKKAKKLKKLSTSKKHYSALKKAWNNMNHLEKGKLKVK